MPRAKPKHKNPGITFRALQPVIDELNETREARAATLGRKVTRTDLMHARNDFARRHMPLDWTPESEREREPVDRVID